MCVCVCAPIQGVEFYVFFSYGVAQPNICNKGVPYYTDEVDEGSFSSSDHCCTFIPEIMEYVGYLHQSYPGFS